MPLNETERLQASLNKLIPVTERLPDYNTATLCVIKYANPDKWWTVALLTRTLDNGWAHFWGGERLAPEYTVSFWMPISAPPKGEC